MTQVSSGETEAVTKKPETTNEHEKPREKKERVRPPTKVVIRRLPPTITKDAFINQISPLPEYDYFYFVRPDKSLGPFAFSRAYINFTKQEDIFTFKEQFDNYTFVDKKGNEFPAVVEFSPFQRLPKKRLGRKRDPKMGTLEEDPAYINFLESKAAKPTETGSTQHCSLEYFPPPEKKKITTTPLLDFVRQRRAERQRMRDERREERRRKEQERKRLKDADRDRRRGTVKPDTGSSRETTSDSVLRSLHQDETQIHKPGEKNKDDSTRVWPHEYESRHKKWSLDCNDPRLYCCKSADMKDDFASNYNEDNSFQMVDSSGAMAVGRSPNDTDAKYKKIKEFNTYAPCKINNDLHNKEISMESGVSEKSRSCPMKESLSYGKKRNRECKRKASGPFNIIRNDYRSVYGRCIMCFKDFGHPALEANHDRLKQTEKARKLKLAASKPEVPQPKVIKIMTLDCDVAKSKDYELKLLVRPPVTDSASRIKKVEYNSKRNRSVNVETCSKTTGFREVRHISSKECVKTLFRSSPEDDNDTVFNKSCSNESHLRTTAQISFKSRCGNSTKPVRNSHFVSGYDMVSRKICMRRNCSCEVKPFYQKSETALLSHDSMKENYSENEKIDVNNSFRCKSNKLNSHSLVEDVDSGTQVISVACEIKNCSNVIIKKLPSPAHISRVTSKYDSQPSNLNMHETVECPAKRHDNFIAKNPWKCMNRYQMEKNANQLDGVVEYSSGFFSSLLASSEANQNLHEDLTSRNKAGNQTNTSPDSKPLKANMDNLVFNNDKKKIEIKNAQAADGKPLLPHTNKSTLIQDMWKMKHDADADWSTPSILRDCTKEDLKVGGTEPQTCCPRSVYIIQDSQSGGFLPAFNSKPKAAHNKYISFIEQTSKKENNVTSQDDNAFRALDANRNLAHGSEWYTPFPLCGRYAGKRGGRGRPPFSKISQQIDCETICGFRSDNQTKSPKVNSSNNR